ncbi:uncharacterized protein EI97DRAFT_404193 [Westerdykella ornata]|uniref:Uncharacterized protein n=1 Tax=Westerdykella ornata TaxID=318751 RepID=A0A6A6JDW5_WESOR|nr:uncharacterized protein EI97DRAFT_404193 [Westerdykella ornata]KAF2273379.1 hypothetical protein EI97DRAFT_404193 [Westerdykella ornata]
MMDMTIVRDFWNGFDVRLLCKCAHAPRMYERCAQRATQLHIVYAIYRNTVLQVYTVQETKWYSCFTQGVVYAMTDIATRVPLSYFQVYKTASMVAAYPSLVRSMHLHTPYICESITFCLHKYRQFIPTGSRGLAQAASLPSFGRERPLLSGTHSAQPSHTPNDSSGEVGLPTPAYLRRPQLLSLFFHALPRRNHLPTLFRA